MEFWKDIKGFEGEYQVSNFGNIKSLARQKGFIFSKERILVNLKDTNGYLSVHIGGKRRSLHRLVAQAFLGLDINNSNTLVCHKDDIKTNNYFENLFLGTAKDNTQDMISKGRRKGCEKPVIQYTVKWKYIKTWKSSTEAYREIGISNFNISSCVTGKTKTAGGFKWKYK